MDASVLFLGGTSIDLIEKKQCRNGGGPIFKASLGGSITNTSLVCAKLGLKVALLSKIGKDPLGNLAIASLEDAGVGTRGIIQDSNVKTPIAVANINDKGNSKYTFYKNLPKDTVVPLGSVPKPLLKSCKIFHFGSSFSHQKGTHEEALKFVKFLKKRGVFITFDPNLRPYAIKDKKSTKNRVFRLLNLVNLAKISEIDLQFLAGQRDPKKGLMRLKSQVKCELILTLGIKGSMALNRFHLGGGQACPPPRWKRSSFIKIPAFKVKVADTIGAGDAFTAGLLYRLTKAGERSFFNNIKNHLIFASAVSAIICTKPGATQALKNLRQVERFLSLQP